MCPYGGKYCGTSTRRSVIEQRADQVELKLGVTVEIAVQIHNDRLPTSALDVGIVQADERPLCNGFPGTTEGICERPLAGRCDARKDTPRWRS